MEKKVPTKLTVTLFIFALLTAAAIYFAPLVSSTSTTLWDIYFKLNERISTVYQLLFVGLPHNGTLALIAEICTYVAVVSLALDIVMAFIYLVGGRKSRFFRMLNKMFLLLGALACLVTAVAMIGGLINFAVYSNNINHILEFGSYSFISLGVLTLICFFLKIAAFAKTKVN